MEDTAARSNIPALVWIIDKLNECPYVASADAAVVYLRLAIEQIEANPSLLKKRAAAADRVPTLEELIGDCIAHQDVAMAERLRDVICEARGRSLTEQAVLLKWLNNGFWGNSTMTVFPCREEAEEFSRDHLILTGGASTGEPNA